MPHNSRQMANGYAHWASLKKWPGRIPLTMQQTDWANRYKESVCKENLLQQPNWNLDKASCGLIVITPHSHENWVNRAATISHPYILPKTGSGSKSQFQSCKIRFLTWARVFCDEGYIEQNIGSHTTTAMLQIPGRPPCWVLTGTLFDKSPNNILLYIKVLIQPHWYLHPELRHCTPEALKSLS
ncbi:hypothetical protein BDW62DRAFT_31407 [Aspergillus aurantiobrunneus]